jgi:hypothetical protein
MFLHNSTLTTYNTGFLEVFDSVYVFSSFYDDRQEITFGTHTEISLGFVSLLFFITLIAVSFSMFVSCLFEI